MTTQSGEMSVDLLCDRCGYDLRAHPLDGKCPECGASVAESRRIAAIPRRPVWRESDPRWRRRMLVGAWIVVFLPLMEGLKTSEWASHVRVPNVFGFPGPLELGETFLTTMGVYEPLVFCMGVVLLFSKERGRRRDRLDWTRRWGVLCSYVVLLLSATQILFIVALVAAGIAALFQSMALKFQPGVERLFVNVSTAYLRYGPYPKEGSSVALVVFSSIAILLACVPLFNALRSNGRKWLAMSLLAPLALFSLMHIARAGQYCLAIGGVAPRDLYELAIYFRPRLLVAPITGFPVWKASLALSAFGVEAAKWCIVLAIAVWLSIAQVAAWRQGKKASDA